MENSKPTWVQKRVRGVTNILKGISKKVVDNAWTVGTVVTVVVYPLAISIIEERVIQGLK